ncbi:MAG TPA: galactokinase [Leptospiraceae bacterium]|nr:galactokinase [Leptospiraceae bacterium]HMY65998.1 galactokinase [Leptospiraceae bacterium]HMZ59474.1 galactokinase [Leptospiraceae bacterium]HNF13156.1 galactokinase [Leptospiraceae bacterium]HNF24382.1 galactokinase [Leptospiraceae bacterium]
MNESLQSVLLSKFGENQEKITEFQSPARINIIGEHVDYLGGLVLPASINFFTKIAIRPNWDHIFRIYSVQFNETVETSQILRRKTNTWANYILGVISEFIKEGYIIPGFDLVVDGNVPQGAGLSSSASLEVCVGYALSSVFHLPVSRTEIAVFAQRAENNFTGTRCGIMDQFAVSLGKKDKCILLNTDTLEYHYKSVHLGESELYLINSNVKHSLETSAYNDRRKDCENALIKIKTKFLGLKTLYQFTETDRMDLFGFTPNEHKRVLHTAGERKRTAEIMKCFEEGDIERAGEILYQTHFSLSENFEVSCPETDFLVEQLRNLKVQGARMVGGGFGGCILVLDKKGRYENVSAEIQKLYKEKFGINPDFYRFEICDGVGEP